MKYEKEKYNSNIDALENTRLVFFSTKFVENMNKVFSAEKYKYYNKVWNQRLDLLRKLSNCFSAVIKGTS
jgi:hypothetical protein